MGLLQCRFPAMTCKKSPPAPTTAFSPTPERRRRSGEPCRTKLLFGRSARPRLYAGEPVASPARIVPTALEQFSGAPFLTTAAGSRSQGSGGSPGMCSRSTNHNAPIRTRASSHPIIGLEGLLSLVDVVGKLSAPSASEREEGSRCTSKERFPPASERRPTASAVVQAAAGQPSSPAVATQSAVGAQTRRRRDASGGGGAQV
jgi:hypothetical protein